MPRGPKPKPTHLKLLAGNPGHRPLNQAEPEAPTARPSVPEYLDDAARAEWNRICKVLEQMGLLSTADRTALAAYCVCYSRWVEAERNVKKSGTIVKSPDKGFPMKSPFLSIAESAMQQMIRLSVEFGLTPSSRSRIRVAPGSRKNRLGNYLDRNKHA